MLGLLSLCLVACFVVKCQAQCDVIEGTTISMSCSVNGNSTFTELQWTLNLGSNNSTILSTCSPSGSCTNNNPSAFTASLTGRTSYLTLTNATRNWPVNVQANFRCNWNPISLNQTVCNSLSVVTLPQTFPCVAVSVNATTKYLNCTLQRHFPYGYCSLQISRDNVSFIGSGTVVNYTRAATNQTPVYYSGSCQLLLGDRFFLSTSYFRVSAYFFGSSRNYYIYSKSFVYNTVLEEVLDTTTQTSIATTTSSTELPTPSTSESPATVSVAQGPADTSPNSGLVTGLAVGLGICAFIALGLAIFIAVFCLRKKKKKPQHHQQHQQHHKQQHVPPKTAAKPTSTVIPEGYNKVTSPESGEEPDNYYEEVDRPNPAPAGANPKPPEHLPQVYLNSPAVKDPSKPSKETAPKRPPYREPGPYSNSPTGEIQGGVSFRGIEEQSSEAQKEAVYVNATDVKLQKTT